MEMRSMLIKPTSDSTYLNMDHKQHVHIHEHVHGTYMYVHINEHVHVTKCSYMYCSLDQQGRNMLYNVRHTFTQTALVI